MEKLVKETNDSAKKIGDQKQDMKWYEISIMEIGAYIGIYIIIYVWIMAVLRGNTLNIVNSVDFINIFIWTYVIIEFLYGIQNSLHDWDFFGRII
jgi:hypothetical protein